MVRTALGIIAIYFSLLFVQGCGTSHYMLPATPLERKEWQISVVWHYDLSRFQLPGAVILPDVNAYVGVGKKYNLGVGAYVIGWPSHLSISKYWNNGGDEYRALFGHVSSGLGTNAPFELGGMLSTRRSDVAQSAQLAFGYGQQNAGLGTFAWVANGELPRRIVPILRYSVESKDVGFTCAAHLFQSWQALSILRDSVTKYNDTLATFDPNELVDVRPAGGKYAWRKRDGETWVLAKASGDSVELYRRPPHPDEMCSLRDRFEYWLGGNMRLYLLDSTYIIQDTEELKRQWQAGKRLVLTRYSPAVTARIRKTHNPWADLSFAFAVYSHPK
jgi:hypothetical protein